MRIFFFGCTKFSLFLGGGCPKDNFVFQKGFGLLSGILLYVFYIYNLFPGGFGLYPSRSWNANCFLKLQQLLHYIMPSSLAKGFRYIMYIRFVKNVVYGLI